jgi:hypothetical protein
LKKKSKIRKKIVKNEFDLCCKGGDPRIYENSIFSAYVPEKNKIITQWTYIGNRNKTTKKHIVIKQQ